MSPFGMHRGEAFISGVSSRKRGASRQYIFLFVILFYFYPIVPPFVISVLLALATRSQNQNFTAFWIMHHPHYFIFQS